MGCVNGGVEVTEPVPCPFFVVTLSGQNRQREGTALGLDDLPALYSQMVRSIVTGRPMDGFYVMDRTNVTEAQEASRKRVQSDSFGYARLGYGSVFGDRGYGGPTLGFGYRAELDSFGIGWHRNRGARQRSAGDGLRARARTSGQREKVPLASGTF